MSTTSWVVFLNFHFQKMLHLQVIKAIYASQGVDSIITHGFHMFFAIKTRRFGKKTGQNSTYDRCHRSLLSFFRWECWSGKSYPKTKWFRFENTPNTNTIHVWSNDTFFIHFEGFNSRSLDKVRWFVILKKSLYKGISWIYLRMQSSPPG